MKLTNAFRAVYRRGRWAHGEALSMGALPNDEPVTRVGLRTRRGLKGATVRNRLKRQLRAAVFTRGFPLRRGLDVVIVIHPTRIPASTTQLEAELRRLCQRVNALS